MDSKSWKIVGLLVYIFNIVTISIFGSYDYLPKSFFFIYAFNITGVLSIFTWVSVRHSCGNAHLREISGVCKEFRYDEIKKATNNFHVQLGQGGSGDVFEGKLDNGTPVAVKRIVCGNDGKHFFEAEIAAIASAQHVNLVRLYGYCNPTKEKCCNSFVVYDLYLKGSLDKWIFPRKSSGTSKLLSWSQRYRIAIDVAKALVYLHHDCHHVKVLHLDVKPENILLGDDDRAVLSDFGLSMQMTDCSSNVCSKNRGTPGYVAPEMNKQVVSTKNDIFGFGKVLLDIFFGNRYLCLDEDGNDIGISGGNPPEQQQKFHLFIQKNLTDSTIKKLIDHSTMMHENIDLKKARILLQTALRCLEEDPNKRPSDMRQVLDKLKEREVDDHESHDSTYDFILEKLPKDIVNIAKIVNFPYKVLEAATRNFQEKIGHGQSGILFKGTLAADKSDILVKRFEYSESGEKVFLAEIVATASFAKANHKHLIHLRGYCISRRTTNSSDFFLIVYDYVLKGSLYNWLIPGKHLKWKYRYGIALDLAKVLVYLHYVCRPQILHLGIETSNILLDNNFQVVLSEFGSSELIQENEHPEMLSSSNTTPEAHSRYEVKCDVYSFGQVLLDLFFGLTNIGSDKGGNLIYTREGNSRNDNRDFHVDLRNKLVKREFLHLVDQRLLQNYGGGVDIKEVETLLDVALSCVYEDPKERPDMQEVSRKLQGRSGQGKLLDVLDKVPYFTIAFYYARKWSH